MEQYGGGRIVKRELPGDAGYDQSTEDYKAQSSGQLASQSTQDFGEDVPDSERTYFENPQKLVEWHTMKKMADSNPSMKLPDGVPFDQIEQAYKYYETTNPGVPVTEWKPPKANDPLRDYLKQIQIPAELLPQADQAAYKDKVAAANQTAADSMQPLNEADGWSKLELSRQLILMGSAAGYDPNMSDRPEWTRAPATLVQGVMGGIAPAALATAVASPIAGVAALLAFGGIAAYQAYTGERIPGISDIYDKFQIPAKALESGIGQLSLDMTPQERMNNILPNMANVVTQIAGGEETPVMAAGRLKYETSKPVVIDALISAIDNTLNLGGSVGLFGGGWKKIQIDQAGEGYRWDIHKGINDPVKIQGTTEDAALNEYWDKLKNATPENFDKVLAEVDQDAYERFGYSGVMNDLVGQTVLDPLNFAPFIEGIGAQKAAKLFKRAGIAPELMGKIAENASRSRGNPLIDVLPIGVQQIAEAIMRGKGDKPDFKPFGINIGDFGKRSSSSGFIGTIESTKREIRAGNYFASENPVVASQLSKGSKQVAGLTPEGTFKELQPVVHLPETGVGFVERQKNRWINWQRDLFSLTPEAKAMAYLDTAKDNLQVMVAGLTPEETVRQTDLLSYAGDSEKVQQTVDAIDNSLNSPEDIKVQKQQAALVNSPTAATTADGLRYAKKEVGPMLEIYHLADGARSDLVQLSKLTGDSISEVVRKSIADPEAYYKEISLKPGALEFLAKTLINTPDDLKTRLGVFTGKDAVALTDDQFNAKYINALTDKMGDYLVKKYDIKPQTKAMQVFGLMKDVQSLLVLGLNPGYYINNMFNDAVSRSAQGVFGFMAQDAADAYYARKGFSPTRLHSGVGASGEGTDVGGMSAISKAAMDKGVISNMRRAVKNLNHKIGLFQNLSQKVEQRESVLAFTIGDQIMRRKVAKIGVGYDPLPANVEKLIKEQYPGMLERMYSGVENSLNMDEVRTVINSEFIKPEVGDVFTKVVGEIYDDPDNPAKADTIRDLITWAGFEPELRDMLSKAKTPEEVDAAVNKIKSRIEENINEKLYDSILATRDEIPNMTQAEGSLAIINIKAKLDEYLSKRYLDHFKVTSDANNILRDATFEQSVAFRKNMNDQEVKKFGQDYAKETAVYAGLVNSGISPEFIDGLGRLHNLSQDYFSNRNRRYNEVFSGAEPSAEWNARYKALQAESDANYIAYNAERTRLLTEIDDRFYTDILNKNPDPLLMAVVDEWRSKVMEMETKRQGMMEDVRLKLTSEDAVGVNREKTWAEFHKTYDPFVLDIINTNNEYANKAAAIYQQTPMESHWTASVQENSTGWLTPEEIKQVMQQGLSPKEAEDYANALVKDPHRSNDLERYIAADPNPEYFRKVIERIQTIRSYLTTDMINKIHEENVRAAERNMAIPMETKRSELRKFAFDEFGVPISYGDRQIKAIVKKYTGLDIGTPEITPEIWREALSKQAVAHRATAISPDAPYYEQRFKFNNRNENIEAAIKPFIISRAEGLLKEFQAGENGYITIGTNPETSERIAGKVSSTNAPWYQYLYTEEGKGAIGTTGRAPIENALKAIIKDPSTAKGKWVDYLMRIIEDRLSGAGEPSIYSSFDAHAQWILGNKNDVAAFFDEFMWASEDLSLEFGGDKEMAKAVTDYSSRWKSVNTRTEPWFTEDGRPNYNLLNAAVNWRYVDLVTNLEKAFQKNEMLESSGLRYNIADDQYLFNDKPVANATPGTKVEGVNGINYQLLGYDIDDPTKLVVHLPGEDKVITIDQNRQEVTPPTGSTPPGKSPSVIDHFEVNNEINASILNGALNQFGSRFKQEMLTQIPGVGRVDPETMAEIQAWVNRLPTQMSSANLAAQRHGEMMRDGALLNYSWRYGIDNYLTAIFPYQFWYTRTMMQWGKRMIDRPAWYSMYARINDMQERTASEGIPSRFAGKIRAYVPWLPEWAGTSMWADPMSQAFPLSLYTNLGESMQYQISSIDRETQQNLMDLVDTAKITKEQYDAAMLDKRDPLYVNAYEDARKKSDMYNPVSLASMMMQPSMWIMDANYLASGTPEKISVLPITKTTRAVGTALKGTPLEFFGNIIEAVGSGPETSIRKSAGLSPYGTWGDYYVDRELANLVAEGKYTATDAMIAMIDRKGDAYAEAENRVKTQDMYKVPLATAMQRIAQSLTDTGKISAIAPALLSSTMPFSVLPEGEMIQRGLAVEYKKAWDMVKAGDLKAINNFFTEHPEYQARLAINKDPDERMKQLLIDQIWNQYNHIPSANKRQVSEGLGDKFQTNFLNTATHDYDTIDIPTLAYWAQALGGQVPDKAGKLPQYQMPKIETYTPEMTRAITDYKNEKNKLFPMVDLQQQMYFDKGSDKSVLAAFPQIKEYWDWKKKYESSHPVLKSYFAANREAAKAPETPAMEPYNPGNFALTPEQMKLFSPSLVKMVVADATAGQKLGEGAIASLRLIWENLGKPDGTLEKWYNNKVKPTFGK